MKVPKVLLYTFAILSAVAILLIVAPDVNHFGKYTMGNHPVVMQADGAPTPPLPPPVMNGQLVADGAPTPPLPPPVMNGQLVADGAPTPPLPPPVMSGQLVADGAPTPPLPPGRASMRGWIA